MNLDKRIIKGKKYLDCFDVEVAKEFIGEECYFTSKPENFGDLSKVTRTTLHNVDDGPVPFQSFDDDGIFCYDCFILPCAWVKEPEEEYRPYSLAEWVEKHEIGEVIHYRSKLAGIEFRHMYMGYAHGIDKDITKSNVGTLTLGVASYSFDYLFEDYEIEINNEWKPFGVIKE